MTWGRVNQEGGVEPIKKPEVIDPEVFDDLPETPPELKELNDAIDAAKAYQLPGAPSQMVPTLSLVNYEPPAGAINSALGIYGS